jgi:Holliday junction resolvase RusA-like endonuclease
VIHIHIPTVPISSNQAYANVRGRRTLTKKGKAYKNETKAYIARNFPEALKFFKPNVPYVLLIEFTFHGRDVLYSKEWPDGRAKNRYKKLDVSNRVKLFEDALADATGLDDSQNFIVVVSKTWHRDFEATNLWVWNREEEGSPIDELVARLKST